MQPWVDEASGLFCEFVCGHVIFVFLLFSVFLLFCLSFHCSYLLPLTPLPVPNQPSSWHCSPSTYSQYPLHVGTALVLYPLNRICYLPPWAESLDLLILPVMEAARSDCVRSVPLLVPYKSGIGSLIGPGSFLLSLLFLLEVVSVGAIQPQRMWMSLGLNQGGCSLGKIWILFEGLRVGVFYHLIGARVPTLVNPRASLVAEAPEVVFCVDVSALFLWGKLLILLQGFEFIYVHQ
jgi:hypothetical protein